MLYRLTRVPGYLPVVIFISVSFALSVGLHGLAAAASKNISQSYQSEQDIKIGQLVSLAQGDAKKVVAANSQNADRLLGVAVEADESLIAVDASTRAVQVAVSGTVNVLVSDVNGAIEEGDLIAVSPFTGLGMRAVGAGYYAGRALATFDGSGQTATEQVVVDKKGDERTIHVGSVSVLLAPGYDGGAEGGENLTSLQQFVQSLTGNVVSMPRLIMSLIIGVLTIATVIALIYAAIYGSLISIGRNPLAKESVLKALVRVMVMILTVVALAFGLIYMLLR